VDGNAVDGAIADGSLVDSSTDAGEPVLDGAAVEDAQTDGGRPALCSGYEPFPEPTQPACTADQTACYRACSDYACQVDCALSVPRDCTYCFEGQQFNCNYEFCFDELYVWDCCFEARCAAGPFPCDLCDAERAAIQACQDTAEYMDYCRTRLEACLMPI
jgi:hypothetical protein